MRAFLAVTIAADLRQRIAAVQRELKQVLMSGSAGIRLTWVKPDTIHLTIKFLGEIDDDAVEPLRAKVSSAIAGRIPIEIPFATLGAFPRIEAPRALWIGPPSHWASTNYATQAQELANRIEEACDKFAVQRDTHPWRPHLTVARVREGQREVGQALRASGLLARTQPIGALGVSEISLMKSEMRPDGPVHTPLWNAPRVG